MSSGHSKVPGDLQEAVFRFLADPKTHGLNEPVERVDTANAVVFLAGADVYKLKRAVKFPFMDSRRSTSAATLAKRRSQSIVLRRRTSTCRRSRLSDKARPL